MGQYYNNVTLRAESCRTGSHVTIIIQNFTLINVTSTKTPHRVWLPFGASVLFLTYALNFSSSYALNPSPSTPQSWQDTYVQAGMIFR